MTPARARRLAILSVAGIEGAVVLRCAQRNAQPLDVGRELETAIVAAVSG